MSQRMAVTVAPEWISGGAETALPRSEARDVSRSRSGAADIVLRGVCSAVAYLAIDPVANHDLLFEQYDYKLRSQRDRLGIFCLSLAPALAGMAIVCGAFTVLQKLRPRD
jgi:hypothetical protein